MMKRLHNSLALRTWIIDLGCVRTFVYPAAS